MEKEYNQQKLSSLWFEFTLQEVDFNNAISEAESYNYSPEDFEDLEILVDHKKQFNKVFTLLYDADYYFEYCNYSAYIDNYDKNLVSFIDKFKDADEINFLNNECIKISALIQDDSYNVNIYKFTNDNYHKLKFSSNRIVKFLRSKIDSLTTYPNNTESLETIHPRFKSNVSPTELVELVKALIESKAVNGTVKEIFEDFSKFFNVELKNPHKTFQDIKNREVGNETLFLDKLKSTLYDTILK